MAVVWIDLEQGRRGSVPARGAWTGHRCIERVRLPVAAVPAWLEWVTWTGPRPWAGAAVDHVVVSLLPGRARLLARLRLLRDVTAGLVPLLLLAAVVVGGPLVGRALLAVVATKALVALLGTAWAPVAELDATGRWVRLSNVSDALAEEVEARMARPDVEPSLPDSPLPRLLPAGRPLRGRG